MWLPLPLASYRVAGRSCSRSLGRMGHACGGVVWLGSPRSALPAVAGAGPSKRCGSSFVRARVVVVSGSPEPHDGRRWCNPRREGSHLKPVRRWVQAEDSPYTDDTSRERFVLASYNILGVHNAAKHRYLYPNVPHDVIEWEFRRELIFQEISRLNADILCLQEVDRYESLLVHMKKKGYNGRHKGRTGGARDGCALFWKEHLHLLEECNIEFNSVGLRDNVAQLFVFEFGQTGSRRIVVGNTHVLFNPKRDDIKLGQIKTLLSKANGLSEKWGRIPVVLAGDFNITPKSRIYKFLSTSKLNIALQDVVMGEDKLHSSLCDLRSCLKFYGTREGLGDLSCSTNHTKIRHLLLLHSAYARVMSNARTRDDHGEPLATSYHSKFLGTVDYIWYSGELACTRVLDTLPMDMLRMFGFLPNKNIGSDHLPLAAEFVLMDEEEFEHLKTNSTTK